MCIQRIFYLYFHFAARKASIPSRPVAQPHHEIVTVHHKAANLFARCQRNYRRFLFSAGLQHSCFKLDRRILSRNPGQIPGRGMAICAAARAFKKLFPGLRISRQQLFRRIIFGNARRLQRLQRTRMEECRNLRDLLVGCGNCRHPLVWTPVANHFANQFALLVVRNQCRTDQIRSAASRSIRNYGCSGCGTDSSP